ncbi:MULTISPECIES: hypothetical protein [Streptomyces]|uniref:hypothetical protein n=1 Tax=Streptomyces TaxID=1883 RepID=UPI001587368B|nr:hypothetical protein [Streptomyces sp. CAI-85]MBO7937007.1 hypothetical protein [Streptomyces sp. S9]NUV61710.1 hypothetical protein [Streptomyces sp. CAI-85]
MGTIVLTGTVVLVLLGFGNPLYWLAAVALLHLYVRHGRGPSTTGTGTGTATKGTGTGTATAAGAAPTSYKAYRDRRDQQAKWERRYRRERGL